MPIKFSCPQCRTTVDILERDTGRKLRCPYCAVVFQGPPPTHLAEVLFAVEPETAPAASLPPDEAPSEPVLVVPELTLDEPPSSPPPPERERVFEASQHPVEPAPILPPAVPWEVVRNGPLLTWARARGWRRVHSGLGLLATSVIVVGLAGLIQFLATPLFQVAAPVFASATVGLMLAGGGVLLWLAGQIQCCGVPPESEARGPLLLVALISFIGAGLLMLGVLVIPGSQWLLSERMLDGPKAGALDSLGVACVIGGLVCAILAGSIFPFFLLSAARFFHDYRLARSIFRFAVVLPLLSVLAIPFGFWNYLSARSASDPGVAGASIVLVEVGTGGLTGVWFLALLLRLRSTIGAALRSREPPVGNAVTREEWRKV